MNTAARRWYALKESLVRSLVQVFMPEISSNLLRDIDTNPFGDKGLTKRTSNHVLVEDHGSNVTVFSFTGGALLFMGLPTFEFRGLLSPGDKQYNMVFLRDVRRMCYHIAPDGQPNGLEFFKHEIRSLMKSLGSDYHVAIGGSVGATAALYFATHCGMEKVIAFSSPFPFKAWSSPLAQARALLDLRRLINRPKEYWHIVLLGLTATLLEIEMTKAFGKKGIWDPIETYRGAKKRPRATIFFGEKCPPDSRIAHMLDGLPETKLVPLPTGRHNSGGYLAKRGELHAAIMDELQ